MLKILFVENLKQNRLSFGIISLPLAGRELECISVALSLSLSSFLFFLFLFLSLSLSPFSYIDFDTSFLHPFLFVNMLECVTLSSYISLFFYLIIVLCVG